MNIGKTKVQCRRLAFTACCVVMFISASAQAETLEMLIALALQNNPEIQTSRLLRDASAAEISSARWEYFPTPILSIESAEVSSNDSSFVGDDYELSVGLVQPIWSGGVITNNLKLAKANFKLSDIELAQTQQGLGLRVLSVYTEWVSAALRVKAWRAGLIIHQDLLQQVQRRTAGGASSESDLSLAKARTSLTEAELFSAIAQEQVARSNLTELVNKTFTTEALFHDQAQAKWVENNKPNLRAKAKRIDPSILLALMEVDVAEAQRRVVRSENLPTLNLRVERQYGDLSIADTDPSNRIFLEFTSRFGAGFSGASNENAAKLRRDAALSNVEAQRRAVDAALVSDLALKDSVERSLAVLKQSKVSTQSVYESFERQFLAGSRSWLDVLNSAREIIQLDLQLADTQSSLILVSWRISILTDGLLSVLPKSITEVQP